MSEKVPCLSVVVRTVGRCGQVVEALASLCRQTRQDFQTVVVDMSEDATGIAPFHARLEDLRHLRLGHRLPRPDALNVGVAQATSDKIAVLDEDNRYDPDHVAALVEGLESTGADLVYTGSRQVTCTPEGQPLDSREHCEAYFFPRLLFENFIDSAAVGFRKSTWERLGGYDPLFPIYEDWDFLIRVGAAGQIVRLGGITAESRRLTGTPGVVQHSLEAYRVPKYRGSIFWKHQRLHTRRARAAYADWLAANRPNITPSTARWLVRRGFWIELLPHSHGWW